MSQGQTEWYTVILPFISIPPIAIAAMFIFWIGPVWIRSFDNAEAGDGN